MTTTLSASRSVPILSMHWNVNGSKYAWSLRPYVCFHVSFGPDTTIFSTHFPLMHVGACMNGIYLRNPKYWENIRNSRAELGRATTHHTYLHGEQSFAAHRGCVGEKGIGGKSHFGRSNSSMRSHVVAYLVCVCGQGLPRCQNSASCTFDDDCFDFG